MASAIYNQASHPARNRTLTIIMETQWPQVSEILFPNSNDHSSVLYFPVGNAFSADATIAGTTSVEFSWQETFRQALPLDSAGIVVLENSYGQTYSYLVGGDYVLLLGQGDLHDTHQYDDMEEVATYTRETYSKMD